MQQEAMPFAGNVIPEEQTLIKTVRNGRSCTAAKTATAHRISDDPVFIYRIFQKHWYKNGNLYSGYMQNGYRHGKGKYTRAEDKYTYDGDWYMSKRHGHGKEELPGQWCFEGEFCDNKRNGFGRLVRTDGEIYEGGWKDDKKHGYGKKTFANGNRYEGDWQEGKEHGYGKETFANGNRYEGEFFAGKHSGKGTYYNAEKTRPMRVISGTVS